MRTGDLNRRWELDSHEITTSGKWGFWILLNKLPQLKRKPRETVQGKGQVSEKKGSSWNDVVSNNKILCKKKALDLFLIKKKYVR